MTIIQTQRTTTLRTVSRPRARTTAALGLLLTLLAGAPTQAQTAGGGADPIVKLRTTPDASAPLLDELPVGEDLWVSVTGALPIHAYRLELWQVAYTGRNLALSQEVNSDPFGVISHHLLWKRTGIFGCSCGEEVSGYPFAGPAEVEEAMLGTHMEVVLRRADGGGEWVDAANAKFFITSAVEPWPYVIGERPCVLRGLAAGEGATLVSYGPPPGDWSTVYVVPHRTQWREGDPLVDVRPGFQGGQVVSRHDWPVDLRFAPPAGAAFDVVIRRGQPPAGTDAFIPDVHGPLPNGNPLVVKDWGCPNNH
ncbi:MAG: hypothetical protein AAFY88_13470 [Acidobacteriota bacterium]